MAKYDKKREKFFTTHSGAKWGDPEYFDLIINSSNVGVDAAVEMLEKLVKC